MLENLAQVGSDVSSRFWKPLIVCTGAEKTSDPCGFDDLIELANVVINNLTVVAVLAASMAFIWVGFQLLTSQGDAGAMSNAKKVGWNVVKGLFFILALFIVLVFVTV